MKQKTKMKKNEVNRLKYIEKDRKGSMNELWHFSKGTVKKSKRNAQKK